MNDFNIGGYHIKNYKEHQTSNGVAYVCTLYRNGKKIGSAEQSGRGGSTRLLFGDRTEQSAFEALAAARPAKQYATFTVPADGEALTEDLITGWQLDRASRTKTMIQTSRTDLSGELEILVCKAATTPEVLQQIKRQDPAATHYWKTGTGWTAL